MNKGRRVFIMVLVILLIVGFAAISNGAIPIGEEDVLQIQVWDHPELTVTVPVRPGGIISVPFVGDVKAAGLMPLELKALLEKDFASYIKVPSVSVVVIAVNSFKIYVMGAGITGGSPAMVPGGLAAVASEGQAGAVTLRRDTSLLQLFAQLHLQRDADLRNAYAMRSGKKLDVDFYKLVVGGDTSQDIQLRPNDLIYVPDTLNQRIRVVGAVKAPGIFPFMDGMTALDAVLSAGGFNDYASQNNVEVVRREGDKVESIRVRLKDVINDGEVGKNLLLKPGDIVKINTGLF